jgi:hypothetical protein
MRLTPVLLPVGLGSRARLDSLGGPDLPILPHVPPASEVDAEVVLEQLACWNALTPGARVIPNRPSRDFWSSPGVLRAWM